MQHKTRQIYTLPYLLLCEYQKLILLLLGGNCWKKLEEIVYW